MPMPLPAAANLATAARGVALEAWPPVLEYTSVSITDQSSQCSAIGDAGVIG